MHFDDRLATVLRQRAAGERAARTQYRQLLDLLDQRSDADDGELKESGWQRLSDLSERIPTSERAAILREGGWRLRNPSLVLFLAEQEADVAASALAVADLTPRDWVLLIPEMPVRARGFLRLRRDLPVEAMELLDRLGVRDRGLPAPESAATAPTVRLDDDGEGILVLDEGEAVEALPGSVPEDDAESVTAESRFADPPSRPHQAESDANGGAQGPLQKGDSIGALVRRIEAFQKARRATGAAPPPVSAASPEPDEPARAHDQPADAAKHVQSFTFTTDAKGAIDWADAQAAPMVVGTPLRGLAQEADGLDDFERALDLRLPLRHVGIMLEGASAIQGSWVLDAAPSFAPATGSFQGYIGRFVRPVEPATRGAALRDRADRLRQLLHELRTPVNAIQGFSELIQQEVAGRTPHAYRALAAAIGGDSARILSGFDDLDRLARLESGLDALAEGRSDLHAVVAATVGQLRPSLRSRGTGFDLTIRAVDTVVPLAQADAELLLWRVLASVTAGAGDDEVLELGLQTVGGAVALSCDLSRELRDRSDLFATDFRLEDDLVSPGVFGIGFALRLARAEARAVGGELRRDGAKLVLTLPIGPSAGSTLAA